MNRVLIPADNQPRDGIPQGAALVQAGHGRALTYFHPHDSFAERCAKALAGHGRMVALDFETVPVGVYDQHDGELRPDGRGGLPRLEAWIGRRVFRNELEAKENRGTRRAQARRLTMQGRTAEAFGIDRRLGL